MGCVMLWILAYEAHNKITGLRRKAYFPDKQYWYIVVWPGLTLVMFVMGWNLVGDALRDVLDPRMRGKT
jgi:peptide/nickel transport system permease protein